MRCKKVIISILILILIISAAFMIYNINSVFPNAEVKVFHKGEQISYKGLRTNIEDVEIYNLKEVMEKYQLDENSFDEDEFEINYTYVIATLTMENETQNKIDFGKIDNVTSWTAEISDKAQGIDISLFMQLNSSYDTSFAKGEKQEIKIPFAIPEYWLTYDDIKKSDVKIYYSFYPTIQYILYEKGSLL